MDNSNEKVTQSLEEKQRKQEGLRRMQELCDAFHLGPKLVNYLKQDLLYYSYGYSMDKITYDSRYPVFVNEFEEFFGGYVYHVIEADTSFGKMLSFLYVGKEKDSWEIEELEGNRIWAYTFIVQDDNPDCWSEGDFAMIVLASPMGYLMRV